MQVAINSAIFIYDFRHIIKETSMRNKPNALANILLTVHTWQIKSKEDPGYAVRVKIFTTHKLRHNFCLPNM